MFWTSLICSCSLFVVLFWWEFHLYYCNLKSLQSVCWSKLKTSINTHCESSRKPRAEIIENNGDDLVMRDVCVTFFEVHFPCSHQIKSILKRNLKKKNRHIWLLAKSNLRVHHSHQNWNNLFKKYAGLKGFGDWRCAVYSKIYTNFRAVMENDLHSV